MKLYYTNTAGIDKPQQKASQSLGGFKSSSPIQNSAFGNLFSDVSLLTIEKNLPEYIGVILINERSNPVSNVKIWMNLPEEGVGKFKVAVVELNSRNEMEMLPSINSKPLFADFYSVNSEGEAIIIPDMQINEQYGLWIERSIDTSLITDIQNCSTSFNGQTIEEVDFKISFTDVEG